jgi:8-oxo-dGTP pyrophosphatase MutT (NUDIX family)
VDKSYSLKLLQKRLSTSPDETANAAVAILIKELQDDLELFLVKRAEVDGDPWSGDMAFPGGKRTSEDPSILATAKRELLEETSITFNKKDPLGVMPAEHSSVRTDIKVQPVLFHFENISEVKLSHELQSYLWAPLKELKNTKTQGNVKGREVPIFNFKGEVIWGLTFRMLDKIIGMLDED